MPWLDFVQIILILGLVILSVPFLGSHIALIFEGKNTFLHPLLYWLEDYSYKIGGIDPKIKMRWTAYTKALLFFNFLGILFLFFIQIFQNLFPLNPENFSSIHWIVALNTALSFQTNTNWEAFSGEISMSYAVQMLGLTVQNFLSASTGFAVFFALIRGIKHKSMDTIGNFWVDLVRSLVYLFLPLSILLAIILVFQGSIQTFDAYKTVSTLEGKEQKIPLGPVASQVAIKQLGSNGGGFFKANSSHPFENPNGISNFLEFFAILLIPASTVYAYGEIMDSKKESWMLFATLFLLLSFEIFLTLYILDYHFLEGIETRIGAVSTNIWALVTTATANGSTNGSLGSLPSITQGIALFNLMLGETLFGGVGIGLCRIIMFILLTVFLSGLLIGRTPQYMGKKIEKKSLWFTLPIYFPNILLLMSSMIVAATYVKSATGLTGILYDFASMVYNNGSSLNSWNHNTPFYIIFMGLIMLVSRLTIIISSLVLAGRFVRKKSNPTTTGMFTTDSFLFHLFLATVIVFTAALIYFPSIWLGPFF